jgi:hypothetical protein
MSRSIYVGFHGCDNMSQAEYKMYARNVLCETHENKALTRLSPYTIMYASGTAS